MILNLKGKNVLVTGEIDGWTRARVEQALTKWGATLASSPTKKVDMFVIADEPSQGKIAKARGLGLYEVPLKKFIMMLRFGEVEIIESAQASGAELGDAIGELRRVLDGPADAARWGQIVKIADEAEAARAEETITYIQGYTSRWAPLPLQRWWAMPLADRWHGGQLEQVCGELCHAPARWTQELMRGEDYAKHALLRAISLTGTRANATMASALLQSPRLSQLRALHLGLDLKLAKGFYSKLADNAHLRALETLVYVPQAPGSGAALAKGRSLGGLRHLHLRHALAHAAEEATSENLRALFEADWIGSIETIEASMNLAEESPYPPEISVWGLVAQHAQRLTSLKRLIVFDTYQIDALIASSVMDQLEELVIAGTWHAPPRVGHDAPLVSLLKRLAARGMPALKRLDLSQFIAQHYGFLDRAYHLPFPLQEVLALARDAEAIVLGPRADKALIKLFAGDKRVIV